MVKKEFELDPGDYRGTYKLIGGQLCFDFTNTLSWRELECPHEWLDSPQNLGNWAQMTAIFDKQEVAMLKKYLSREEGSGTKEINQLKHTREIIYGVFNAQLHKKPPSDKDLTTLNSMLKKAMNKLELAPSSHGFELTWQKDISGIEKIQYSVVRSALEVLTTKDLSRVKKCPSCQWLYLDKSKNKSRRWCTMEDCGNRHKVNAFNKNRKKLANK